MPPKTALSKTAAAAAATETDEPTPSKEASSKDGINIEDLNLPKSIVTRLAKGALPANTQIQSNAMLAMQKAATVFVNYLAAGANENAGKLTRKTISPQDVFKALEELEFGDFVPRLEGELARFVEIQSDKRTVYRKKIAAADKGAEGSGNGNGNGEPAAKKVRREEGEGEGDETMALEEEEQQRAEEEGEGEGEGDGGDDTEDEEEEGGGEAEEREEEVEEEEREVEDEAMDNGEDSD